MARIRVLFKAPPAVTSIDTGPEASDRADLEAA